MKEIFVSDIVKPVFLISLEMFQVFHVGWVALLNPEKKQMLDNIRNEAFEM